MISFLAEQETKIYIKETAMTRQLASIRRIDEIKPIKKADAIEVAVIGGWEAVVKKGDFLAGELVIFLEIDSWVPRKLAPFLFEGKTFNGVEGARLRTKKLRGVISQGLVLKSGIVSEYPDNEDDNVTLTELLGVQKWERPVTEQGNSKPKGTFPFFIPKTDQERVQNLDLVELKEEHPEEFDVTLKLDGSSMTIFYKDEESFGVCSRNQELKSDDESHFTKFSDQSDSLLKIKRYCGENNVKLAFQGELMGGKIQGNREGFNELRWFIFDVFDIEAQKYISPDKARKLSSELDFEHVPHFGHVKLADFKNCKEFLDFAGQRGSINNKVAEGVVFRSTSTEFSFKAINNEFLLKGGD